MKQRAPQIFRQLPLNRRQHHGVDEAHAWLVRNAQWIEDEYGVVVPVDFYTLDRMREVKARYGDYRSRRHRQLYSFGDGSPEQTEAWAAYFEPSKVERRMMSEYDALMELYATHANRETDADDRRRRSFGSWALIVAFLAPWVLFVIAYILWRWLN